MVYRLKGIPLLVEDFTKILLLLTPLEWTQCQVSMFEETLEKQWNTVVFEEVFGGLRL